MYSSHTLEYFDAGQPGDPMRPGVEVFDVLSEWKRVLKPGGAIRLAVPDFDSLVKARSH